MKKILTALAIAAAVLVPGVAAHATPIVPVVPQGNYMPCRIIKGEMQGHVADNPACQMDVLMYPATLNGNTVATRCGIMGGRDMGPERWFGATYQVCHAVGLYYRGSQ